MSGGSLAPFIVCFIASLCVAKDVHFFVGLSGSDQNNGLDVNSPVKTLSKAVSLASSATYTGNNLYIELLPGYHDLGSTLYIGQHHGKLLTIRSYNDQEVHITGGRRIPSSSFRHVSDSNTISAIPQAARQFIRYADLRGLNITNYGTVGTYGFYTQRTAPLEVFHNSQPLHMARWPNEGFINIEELPNGKDGLKFRYNSTRPMTWKNVDDLWVYGYWYKGWEDLSAKVSQLDAKDMLVTLDNKTHLNHGLKIGTLGRATPPGVPTDGGFFRFINVLSELDASAEYYVDKKAGHLYTWMPTPDGSVKPDDIIYISLINTCIQINSGVQNVVFSNFIVEACRLKGIYGHNVRNIQVKNMEIRNTGDFGIYFDGDSRDCIISKTAVHDGDGGLTIQGGNRKTLESGGNIVEDCEIYRYSREGAVGKNAISLGGVGNLVRYNNMYIGQYTAIRYSGNDHVIEYNHIYNTCMNSSDCGAIHTGRDWTFRGNIIRYNIVHHTLRFFPGADVRGVMLDDQVSSVLITNNVFYANEIHVNIGGGRDNVVTNNVMYNATKASMQIDGRGALRSNNLAALNRRLQGMPYTGPLWSLRYPALASIDTKNKTWPEGNQIHRNLIYNMAHTMYIYGYSGWLENPLLFNVTDSGFAYGPGDFFDVDGGDFRVKCHAEEWANHVNFKQAVTINDVGPRYDVGPAFGKIAHKTIPLAGSGGSCTTNAPATVSPIPAYLPDGSGQKPLFNVTSQGCWLSVSKCSNDPKAVGLFRDVDGEVHHNAGNNVTSCFDRAVTKWHYCGSKPNEEVAAIYGPTGETTFAGDGCFMALYGCPRHGSPADGHVIDGRIYRDNWAEQHINGAHNETSCLSRAVGQWRFCGSHPNHTITSIYRPTGAFITAGAGCWIQVLKCPKHPQPHITFYDTFGATNVHSDDSQSACFSRAEDYWVHCGADRRYPVTTFYRPTAQSTTFPAIG